MDNTPEELIPTRATLIERLKDLGDQASWAEFFETYWALIYGVAVKAGLKPEEAEDVVQDTMIAVAKNLPEFKYDPNIGSFKGWLLTTTRWRITDLLRRRGPVHLMEPPKDDDEGGTDGVAMMPDLENIWNTEWESHVLTTALARARRRLDPKHYQIFDCYVNKKWPPDKVAKLFRINVAQVYLVKNRATDAIKNEVEKITKGLM